MTRSRINKRKNKNLNVNRKTKKKAINSRNKKSQKGGSTTLRDLLGL